MRLSDRAGNVLTGFALLDLLKITAELECSRRSLPRGSLWLAPETQRNLQHCALGLLSVCLSKEPEGSPWWSGHHRLAELGIECFFGRLRSQSASAQLTARSYWQCSARDMIRTHHDHNGRATEAPKEVVPPLAPDRLHEISERAYKAALQLAALAAGVTMASLDEMYRQWCSSGRFNGKDEGQNDENMEDDEDDERGLPDGGDEPDEGQVFLDQLRAEAALGEDGAEDENAKTPDVLSMDLGQVPDKDMMQICLLSWKGQFDYEEDIEPEEMKDVSPTLFHTFWGLGDAASQEEILDGVWRLLMYLRHWRGGSDRDWISNPRMCRKRSKALNWHQWPS